MGVLSSRSYIKLHALFQLALAAYLTNSREVISESDLDIVYAGRNGRIVIDPILPAFSRPRSPFAYCGILLLLFAIFDLTLALKLPTLNHFLAVARYIRETTAGTPAYSPTVRKITDEFTDLYRHICIIVLALRLSVFMIVAVKIGLSPAELWSSAANGGGFLVHGFGKSATKGASTAADLLVSVEELKYRVVLVYGVMEALFSAWVMTALYDEQVETGKNLAVRPEWIRANTPRW